MGKRNHAEKDALVGKSTRISQDKSYPVSPGFQGFLLRNMILFLYLASPISYPLGSHLPTRPPKPVWKVSPKSMPFEVM